jgi:hypothetical protein
MALSYESGQCFYTRGHERYLCLILFKDNMSNAVMFSYHGLVSIARVRSVVLATEVKSSVF